MAELSSREHEILDMILYLRHQLGNLLPEEQATELEVYLSRQLDDLNVTLTPTIITSLLQEIRKYEPVRVRMEELSGTYLLRYDGPPQPRGEGPIVPLGERVVCPQEGHDGNDPYITNLRKQGQRCPIHDIYLVPL